MAEWVGAVQNSRLSRHPINEVHKRISVLLISALSWFDISLEKEVKNKQTKPTLHEMITTNAIVLFGNPQLVFSLAVQALSIDR